MRIFPRNLSVRAAAFVLALIATPALAQTQPAPLDLRLHDLPQPSDEASGPIEDAADADTSVHGSVSTGIGYSKAWGHSSVNSADLDVTKRTDSGRTLDLHIGVLHSEGVPDYVRRYPNR